MRALINATGYHSELEPFIKYRPSPMLNILDQPILFFVIDFLQKQNIRKVDIVLSHLPYLIENFLEKGAQWGIEIRYHLTPDPQRPYRIMKIISEGWRGEPFLLGRADELPLFEFPWLFEVYKKNDESTFLYYPDREWSGWALGNVGMFDHLEGNESENVFINGLKALPHQEIKAKRFLEVKNLKQFHTINLDMLIQPNTRHLFPPFTHSPQKGIWLSPSASLHTSVKVTPPVYIGEHCQIKENVSIGPNVVMEKNCVVGEESQLDNSLVMQQSFIGKGLEIKHCLVDRHHVYNLKHDSHVLINDELILSEMEPKLSWEQLGVQAAERGFALIFLFLFSPFFLYLLFTRKVMKKETVSLPAGIDTKLWKTFDLYRMPPEDCEEEEGFLTFIPMLVNILQGDLHWVGTQPRSKKEIQLLPPEWRTAYMQSKPGLITIEMIELSRNPTSYEKYTAEAYYTANMSFTQDLWFVIRWLFKSAVYSFRRIFALVND